MKTDFKNFMSSCYKCNSKVEKSISVKEEIELNCMKCPKCGEEYFTSSELTKFDILNYATKEY